MPIHRRPPAEPHAVLAVLREQAHLSRLVHDLHTLGRHVVLVRGTPEQLRTAEARLAGFQPEHLDRS